MYIAEPIFSEKLQKFDSDTTFPPVKKIGITTDHPERRERELLGTISPVKVAIVKAWTGIDARKVESMLHTILDNTRLDGEYFWDGNEILIDAVTEFIESYHPEAQEIAISDDTDVMAATEAVQKKNSQRIYTEVSPKLEALSIQHNITKNGNAVRFKLGEYHFHLHLGGKTGGRYTLTIWSKSKSTEQALIDFPNSQECSANSTEGSNRVARIPMSTLEIIMCAITYFVESSNS
ncbi:MAG: GIY-YIG nuclease family protein [Candidatus Reddybacter sp.]